MNYNVVDIIFWGMVVGVIIVFTVVWVICGIYTKGHNLNLDLEPGESRRFREQERLHRLRERGTGDKGDTGRGGE